MQNQVNGRKRGRSGLTALRSTAFEERLADARVEAKAEKDRGAA
jgi:hypothetical protein